MRFLRSLVLSLLAVLVVGGIVMTTVGASTGPSPASSTVGAQTEDDTAEAETSTTPVVTETSIDRLLASVFPTAAAASLPSGQRVVLSRDPFQPVVPTATPPPTGGTDGGTNGGTDGGTNGGTDGGADPSACTGGDAEAVCDGVVVTLDGFSEDGSALVVVDGTTYEVDVDDEFATSFRVLAINPPCATLLYGDEVFSICTGTTVLK